MKWLEVAFSLRPTKKTRIVHDVFGRCLHVISPTRENRMDHILNLITKLGSNASAYPFRMCKNLLGIVRLSKLWAICSHASLLVTR